MTITMCQHNNIGPGLMQRRRTSLYMSLLQVKPQESEIATKKKSSTSVFTKDYGPTTFITGMRAYAAVAVMLTHAGGAGLRTLGPLGQHLIELGSQGVTVFFVISGFSVASSWEHSGSFTAYLYKRLARIVPLYYAWLFAATLTSTDAIEWQRRYGTSIDAYNMIMHLTFMSWCDYRIACTILGVEWSIPIEVIWYLAIPFLLQQMSTAPRVACAVAGSLAWLVIVVGIKQILPLTAEDSATLEPITVCDKFRNRDCRLPDSAVAKHFFVFRGRCSTCGAARHRRLGISGYTAITYRHIFVFYGVNILFDCVW